MSNAHLGVAPLPPQLRSHAVELDSLEDEIPPPATYIPSVIPPLAASTATSTAAFDSKLMSLLLYSRT